jgi:drug/metabolite transporter (DMT)-like permease
MDRRGLLTGYLLTLAGAALFSSKAIFIKLAYREQADALLILAWRMIFSLPAFLAVGLWALARARRRGEPWPDSVLVFRALLTGLVGYYLAMVLDFEGLVYVSAQLERLALFTYPIFLLFIGRAFFGGRLDRSHLIAASLSYLGLALVFLADFRGGGSNVALGLAFVLGSALSFAVYQLLAISLIAGLGSVIFTAIALSAAAVTSLAHFYVARGGFDLAASPTYLVLAAATGLIATVIPSFLVNAGMARIGAQSTAMISTISPFVTIYLAVILLNERFGLIEVLGTALVVGGVGYHTWRDLRKRAT